MTAEVMKVITTLLGGIAVFIFAIGLMSEGLQKTSSKKIKNIVDMFTINPFVGILAGILISVVFQSSSTSVIMVLGLLNARILRLPEAVSVIFGANIGTTITAQLIAFNVGQYGWVAVFIGFVMMFFIKKNERVQNVGEILFGLGLIFVAMNTMSGAAEPIVQTEKFSNIFSNLEGRPFVSIFTGMGFTALFQSSSAVIAVIQNFAEAAASHHESFELITYLPLLFGCNIGTTFTAILASLRLSADAKRAAAIHVFFNLITTTVCMILIVPFEYIIENIHVININDAVARDIANSHLLFNIIGVLMLTPFIKKIVKVSHKIIAGESKYVREAEPAYIQLNMIENISVSIMMSIQELRRSSKMVMGMILDIKKYFATGEAVYAKDIEAKNRALARLLDYILEYISKIMSEPSIGVEQKHTAAMLMQTTYDIRCMGDYCISIAKMTREQIENDIEFNDEMYSEIYRCFDIVKNMLQDAFTSLEEEDVILAEKVLKQEEVLNALEVEYRENHIYRDSYVNSSPTSVIVFTNMLDYLERIGDSCNNVAEVVVKINRYRKSDGYEEENFNN